MAVPVWQSSQQASISPATSVTITKPTSTASGDLLVASIVHNTDEAITAPAGWSEARSVTGSGSRCSVFWLIAGGSEPASYSFSWATSGAGSGIISRITGAHATTPIDVSSGQQTNNSTSATAPSITTTGDDRLLYFVANADGPANTFTAPGGMTERDEISAGAGRSQSVATESFAAAGATGTRVGTLGAVDDNKAVLVAVAATAGGGGGGDVPVWGSHSTVSVGNQTSATVSRPTGTADGDLLVALVHYSIDSPITGPAGWTMLAEFSNGTASRSAVFHRTAAGEPSSYAFSAGTAAAWYIVVGRISGQDSSAPIDIHGKQANSSSTSVTAPSVTTAGTDRLLVFFGQARAAAQTSFSTPSGMTGQVTNLEGSGRNIKITTEARAASGATGTRVATLATAADNLGWLIAIKPAGGTSPPTTGGGISHACQVIS